MSDPPTVLEAECRIVSDVVLGLPEEAFARPTRCPPWDVKALVAHLWRDVDRILAYADAPAPSTSAGASP